MIAVLLAAALVPAAQEQRPADPYYDCSYIFRGTAIFHGTLAERAPIVRGDPAGTARQPSCNPYPKSDRTIPVFRLGEASPQVVLVDEDPGRSLYVRGGTFPELPDHPAHDLIFGRPDWPDERAGLSCGRARTIRGRLSKHPRSGVPLVIRGQELTIDARTRVRGGRRVAGQLLLRRGDRVAATVRTCPAPVVGRVTVVVRLRA